MSKRALSLCGKHWKALESNPYDLPSAEDHIVEIRNAPHDYFVVCQHVSGWDGWQMAWYFEYYDVEPTTPELPILMLRYCPLEFEALYPKTNY